MTAALMRLLGSPHKAALFALLGGIGGLAGAAAGEAVRLVPDVRRALTGRAGDASPAVEESVFLAMDLPAGRREELGRQVEAGEVEVGLVWHNANDLDLHCIEPGGGRIYFGEQASPTGGALDLDANFQVPFDEANPAEHIRWRTGEAPPGRYKVLVRHFANHGGTDPTPYQVAVRVPGLGGVRVFDGLIAPKEEKEVFAFDLGTDADGGGGRSSAAAVKEFAYAAGARGLHLTLPAVFVGVALVIGQNRGQRRPLLNAGQCLRAVLVGTAAGLAAGAVGEGWFLPATRGLGPAPGPAGLVSSWGVLGVLLGLGVSKSIPNTPRMPVAAAAGLGGLIVALAFLALGAGWADRDTRLAGPAVLGSLIGLMIAVAEEVTRGAWLVIHWGPSGRTILNLGRDPVVIGSGAQADVPLPRDQGFPAAWAAVTRVGGRIELEEKASRSRQPLRNGSELKLGVIRIEVKTAR